MGKKDLRQLVGAVGNIMGEEFWMASSVDAIRVYEGFIQQNAKAVASIGYIGNRVQMVAENELHRERMEQVAAKISSEFGYEVPLKLRNTRT